MVINTSSNVSNFDYSVTLDISGVTAKAIIEDISTYIGAGATNIIGINLKLLRPGNIYFHESTYPPTVDIFPGLTDFEVNLPTFQGQAVLGTYKIYATLIDQDGTQYIWTENGKTYKEVTICKPNTLEFAKGNLGGLGLEPDFDCDTLTLTVGDTTPYSYKGQVPIDSETDIVVSFPTDTTGTIGTLVAEFVPFSMQFSLTGTYDVTGTVIKTYKFSDTTFVIAGYYYSKTFDVQCQYSLCQALCDYENLKNEVKQCATMSPALAQDKQRKLTIISALIIQAKLLNNCGVDFGDILEEIRTVGGFECNCNCESKGVTGLALPVGASVQPGVMCGDISMSVTQVNNVFKINLSDTSYSMGVEQSIQPYVSFETVVTECAKQFVLSIDFCAAVEALGCSGGGGSGTVTDFSAGNLSPLFTTSVVTSTTTPALSFAAISQAANLFYASPNGVAGIPTFRVIVEADLPDLGGTYWKLTGNTTGNDNAFIGTIDNRDYSFYTNSLSRARLFKTGELGIGITAAPSGTLHVKGQAGQSPLYVFNSAGTRGLEFKEAGTIYRDAILFSVLSDGTTFNTSFGLHTGAALTAGSSNSFFGYNAGVSVTAGGNSSIFGAYSSGVAHGDGTTAFGRDAILASTGGFSTSIGAFSGVRLTSGLGNIYIGYSADYDPGSALLSNITGNHNIAIGTYSKIGGSFNSTMAVNGIGTASNQIVFGGGDAVVGYTDMYAGGGVVHATPFTFTIHATSGSGANIAGANLQYAVGQSTGNATPGDHIFYMAPAGAAGSALNALVETFKIKGTTGAIYRNGVLFSIAYSAVSTSWGASALASLTSGVGNTAVGANALFANTSATFNTGIGNGSLESVNTGRFNSGIGAFSGLNLTTGEKNIFVGEHAGYGLISGSANSFLGFESHPATDAIVSSVGIGYNANVTVSNQLAIGAATDGFGWGVINHNLQYWSSTGIHGTYFRTTTPEGAQAAQRGSITFLDDGATGAAYIKQTGTGNTGWAALLTSGASGTIPVGTTGQTLYYAANGNVVTATSNLFNDGANVKVTYTGLDYLNIDPAGSTLTIGNPTDTALQIVATCGSFGIAYGGLDESFIVDGSDYTVLIGDTQSSANGTILFVQDDLQQILMNAANGIGINKVASGFAVDILGAVKIDGKLTVTGAIDPTHLYLDEQVGDPANVANKGILYTKDVTGVTQLFYEASDATVTQLTPLTGGGTVTSVSGTANRITSTGGATPVIDISATFEALLGKVASPLSQFAATTSLQLKGVISDETGSGALVFADTPTLVTPVLGGATATSINKVAITAPATSATLTIADGKTLTVSDSTTFAINSITFAGTEVLTLAATKNVTFADAFITSGAFSLTLTTTASTSVTLPTSGTLYGTLSGSITSAQLATSLSDELGTGLVPFQNPVAEATIASTIAWTGGTAPATPLAEKYMWTQTGKEVTVWVRLEYTTAGVTNTDLTIDFMGDLPTPAEWTSWDNSEGAYSFSVGLVGTTRTNDPVANARGCIKKTAGGAYQFDVAMGSISAILLFFTAIYPTA